MVLYPKGEKKNAAINFLSSCRNETQQSETTTNCWSDAMMQQVLLCFLLVLKSVTIFGKKYTNGNLLSVRKLKDS